MNITDDHTIGQAKQFLRDNWEDGCRCPACEQHVKLYRRKITSAMAYGLILFHRRTAPDSKAIHVESFFKDSDCPASLRADFAKLRWWDMINRHEEKTGYYSMTPKGHYFVKGEITVPRYCRIFNNRCYGFSNECTDINRALGDKFSYSELMGRSFEPKYKSTAIQTKMFSYE